jgi:hypothetical protein
MFPIVLALLVGGAFLAGTQYAAQPVAPVVSRTIQTQCRIDTTKVQQTVEDLRANVNARRAHKLTSPQFEHRVAAAIPKVAKAVRGQAVTCKTLP